VPDIVAAFRSVAAEFGGSVAVAVGGRELTYRRLDELSTQLATHLVHVDRVQAEEPVGVTLDRDLRAIVVLLGILKAGAAYVPLDPASPPERLERLMALVRPRLVIAAPGTAVPGSADILDFDRPGSCPHHRGNAGACACAGDPGVRIHPRQLAYVITTSGSSGEPKAVGIEHIGVVNLATWMRDAIGISVGSRVTQNAPLTFDASVQQWSGALLNGAALLPLPASARTEPDEHFSFLGEERVTTWDCVPSIWRELINFAEFKARRGAPITLPDLRSVLVAGEELRVADVNRWHAAVQSPATIWNVYGPTEATVDAIAFAVPRGFRGPDLPIGRPIKGMSARLVAPQGVVAQHEGEICLSGPGVARGYLGDPAGTAAVFVPNPASLGARMYRTRDLATVTAAGQLVFRGRMDDVLKINGVRVSLTEIEHEVRRLTGVEQLTALAEETDMGWRVVTMYVSDADLPDDTLRQLRQHLPAAMVPSVLRRVTTIPIGCHGKLDRTKMARRLYQPDEE